MLARVHMFMTDFDATIPGRLKKDGETEPKRNLSNCGVWVGVFSTPFVFLTDTFTGRVLSFLKTLAYPMIMRLRVKTSQNSNGFGMGF